MTKKNRFNSKKVGEIWATQACFTFGSTPKQLVDYGVNKEDLPLFGRQHEGTWGASEHCDMLPDGGYIMLMDAVVLKR